MVNRPRKCWIDQTKYRYLRFRLWRIYELFYSFVAAWIHTMQSDFIFIYLKTFSFWAPFVGVVVVAVADFFYARFKCFVDFQFSLPQIHDLFSFFCVCFVFFLNRVSSSTFKLYKHASAIFFPKSYKNYTITWFNIIFTACGKKDHFLEERIIFFHSMRWRKRWKYHDVTKHFAVYITNLSNWNFNRRRFHWKSSSQSMFYCSLFFCLLCNIHTLSLSSFMFANIPLLCVVTTSFSES